jgi:hypothetical protein
MDRQGIVRTVCIAAILMALLVGPARGGPDAGNDTSGFRLESDPRIETVFGDAGQYRLYIDHFFSIYAEMQKTRDDFSRNVQAVLAVLSASPKRCPVDSVAVPYTRAFNLGQTYHRLGKDLEARHTSIKELDDLGETAGLTPDYRWKVAQAIQIYPGVLKEFREMKVAFQEQLASEIRYAGCDAQVLIARGEELEKAGAPPTAQPTTGPAQPARKGKIEVAPPVSPSTATFFVDNGSCAGGLKVFVDGAPVGEVGGKAKAAFRTQIGHHELCLIPASSKKRCGDQGTVRRIYIHDGWSISMRCD